MVPHQLQRLQENTLSCCLRADEDGEIAEGDISLGNGTEILNGKAHRKRE